MPSMLYMFNIYIYQFMFSQVESCDPQKMTIKFRHTVVYIDSFHNILFHTCVVWEVYRTISGFMVSNIVDSFFLSPVFVAEQWS